MYFMQSKTSIQWYHLVSNHSILLVLLKYKFNKFSQNLSQSLLVDRAVELSIDDVVMENGASFSRWKYRRLKTSSGN